MSQTMQLKLSDSAEGRILMHLARLCNGGSFSWCIKGILREFRPSKRK